ncbi:MAG: glycosyltransferase family 2 protein [Candidatus Competibacterales bacterium]
MTAPGGAGDTRQSPKASVVIPVKNGGPLLKEVLQAVLQQATPWPFEVLVIDSGSGDGSVATVQALGVQVVEIAPEAFGHGRTRNLGAELTTGEFIVFITQDALPSDEHWLNHLVAAAEQEAPVEVAGAFGRHLAYAGSHPAIARDLANFFRGFGETANVVHLEDPARYGAEVGYRQFLHFFSSNNACLRRRIWEQIPLPEVDFAEDQQWAKAIIEAGYGKAYAPDAVVYHSHNLGVWESYRRAFDESRAFKRHFGYDLMPRKWDVLRQGVRLTLRDWRWIAADCPSWPTRLYWWFWTPSLTLAKLLGMYAGNHPHVLPTWLTRRSSRDGALQKS